MYWNQVQTFGTFNSIVLNKATYHLFGVQENKETMPQHLPNALTANIQLHDE